MTSDDAVTTESWGLGPCAWSIVVHGGAGELPPERRALHVRGCERAAAEGARVLAAGGTAIDAVQRAVEVLEDDPLFNAGTGACLDADGSIELDASIMDGASLRGGGVCALPPFRNPIAIARRVLEQSRHVLLAGEGAARFAVAQGFARVEASEMITAYARARWEAVRTSGGASTAGGTVGAVAKDAYGSVAAATSTGGMVNKLAGRVGDSPILGAGTYADDRAGACSTTGHGEAMMRVCLAKTITDGVASRLDMARTNIARTRTTDGTDAGRASVCAGLRAMHERTGERGGAIVCGRDGSLGVARTTVTMTWAARWTPAEAPSGTEMGASGS